MSDQAGNALNFAHHNPGFGRLFHRHRLSLGLFFPIEAYSGDIPRMENQIALAKRAEEVGFDALWFRDVPLRDPSFGDVGQIYDPWVFLGYVTAQTRDIVMVTGSIVLTLRHPLHVAKQAASVENLSGGRLVLGVASGDRPIEFPAFGRDIAARSELFRESFHLIRRLWTEHFPQIDGSFGYVHGADLLPKPAFGSIPMLVTGGSGQSIEWTAEHADGWITYPRPINIQAESVGRWRRAVQDTGCGLKKPFSQSLYIDLSANPDEVPSPIHLGWRFGRNHLTSLLDHLWEIGVDHVAFNLKYCRRPAGEVLEELGENLLAPLRGPAPADGSRAE